MLTQSTARLMVTRQMENSGLGFFIDGTGGASYSSQVTENEIKNALLKLMVPRHAEANVRSLLEDAPVTLLARLVEQIHGESQAERAVVWGNMRKLARQMHVIQVSNADLSRPGTWTELFPHALVLMDHLAAQSRSFTRSRAPTHQVLHPRNDLASFGGGSLLPSQFQAVGFRRWRREMGIWISIMYYVEYHITQLANFSC